MKSRPVCLWIDFMANQNRLLCEKEQHRMLKKAKESGVKEIVIDGKIPYGFTTFPSLFSYHVASFGDGRYKAWEGRDFVWELLCKGKEYGFFTWVKLDVFSEGHKDFQDLIWEDKHKWAVTYLNTPGKGRGSSHQGEDGNHKTLFVNPASQEVQDYAMAIIEEVLQRYDADGIILDRARYPNMFADFGRESLEEFSKWLGCSQVTDVREILSFHEREERWIEGALYKEWITFRSEVIKDFTLKVKEQVQRVSPGRKLALYTGAWYETSHEEGLNWASATHSVDNVPEISKGDAYRTTNLAEVVDRIFTGCYYGEIYQSRTTNNLPLEVTTVEGSITRAKKLVEYKSELYGGLYLLHYKDDRVQLAKAMEMINQHCDGVMLFDLVYFDSSVWDVVRAFVEG